MPLQDGQTFAGYTILKTLGIGGMGEVYLAQHPRLPRPDALKVLPKAVASDEFRQRFNREADLAAQLFHPHVVGIHDRGEEDGQLWISMDYVAGTDVNELMSEKYPSGMPSRQAAEIITAVASALDYAHQRGLLHRDVKPANILLADPETDLPTADQRIFLADFGIARSMFEATNLTATNTMIATIAYASPEQLSGRPMDGRSDQYSLACTAYDLLTGSAPFSGGDPIAIVGQHLSMPAPLIGYRQPELASLDPVVAKALAKDPQARYASCTEFAKEMTRRIESDSESGRTSATVVAPWSPTPPAPPTSSAPQTYPPYPTFAPPGSQSGSSRTLLIIGCIIGVLSLVAVATIVIAFMGHDSNVAGPSESSSTQSPRATSSAGETFPSATSPSAPPAPPSTLVLDGQPRTLSGETICATQDSKVTLAISDLTVSVTATLGLGNDPAVQTVGLGDVDGVTLGYSAGADRSSPPAVAHKDGNTYTITGTAAGVDMANPLVPVKKSFELVATCP
jgi:serine/threonine protein kinase, bacterial